MANPLFQPVLAARCLLLNEINDIRGRLTGEEKRGRGEPVYILFERRVSSTRIACSVYGGIHAVYREHERLPLEEKRSPYRPIVETLK